MWLKKNNIILFALLLPIHIFGLGLQPVYNISQGMGLPLLQFPFWNVEQSLLYPSLLNMNSEQGIALGYYSPYQISEFPYAYVESTFSYWRNKKMGIHLSQMGNDLYSEQQVSLAVGWAISKRFLFGTKFNFFHQQIKNYPSHIHTSIDVDILAEIYSNMFIHLQINNVVQKGDSRMQDIPLRMQISYGYALSKNNFISVGFQNSENRNTLFLYSFSHLFYDRMLISFAQNPLENRFQILAQLKIRYFSLGYMFSYHPLLSETQGIEVMFLW